MLKTFIIGILLGIAAAAGALYALPLVDLHREESIVRVAVNGGTRESFHINVPMDRILIGDAGTVVLPETLEWPDDAVFNDLRTEAYKLRNERDTVIGVAARTVAREGDGVIEWVVHLPARGSMFVAMTPRADASGARSGTLVTGTREFAGLGGGLTERWVADESGADDAPAGRLELEARYLGSTLAPLPGETIDDEADE